MKPSLLGERASSERALPTLSRFARARAWAKESLLARMIALALGLGGLAVLGDTALARGAAAPLATPPLLAASSPASAGPAPVASMPGLTVVPLDAGVAPSAAPVATAKEDDAPAAEPSASSHAGRATPDDPVNLNTATLDDLRRLPGVGAKRAEAILTVRARLGGRFRQIEDLLKVKGIGRAALRKIHPLVRL